MRPILYPADETKFTSLGLGVLSSATECLITEARNGVYELQMNYPVTGNHYSSIKLRCLIYAEVNQEKDRQPFRIYKITKPMNGVVTIYAQHLSYDLSGIVLSPFSANNIQSALVEIPGNSSTANPFTFVSDKSTVANFSVKVPSTVRSIMGGQSGSLLDVYGGEYAYDRYTVSLLKSRGADHGVTLRYGKNLTDLTQEENIQNMYTGVYPYWSSEDEYVELSEKIVYAEGNYTFSKIKPLDVSTEYDSAPTEDQLRNYATSYIKNNDVGIPSVSISVKFAPLEQTEEYKDIAPLQAVRLCDTITVIFDRLGVDATAKCVKTVYDSLKSRYKEIEIGDAKTNITDTILSQGQEIQKVSNPEFLQPYINSATQIITGNKGGYVVLHSSTGGSTPDEILVMDTPSVNTATKVWRWNKSGLGYSSNGYNGPYGLAMTMDGKIVADFVATGTLDAELVNVINLTAQHVSSTANGTTLSIDGAEFQLKKDGNARKSVQITYVSEELPIIYVIDTENDEIVNMSELSGHHLKVGGKSANAAFQVNVSDGASTVRCDSFTPSGNGNCKWEYNSTIGKYILVQQ